MDYGDKLRTWYDFKYLIRLALKPVSESEGLIGLFSHLGLTHIA